ncbi:MAG: CapA family protein [Candidatus Nanopelagicales bacterium]|nr:CapA family protein [Candidatus Nanopelagicales bacterium]
MRQSKILTLTGGLAAMSLVVAACVQAPASPAASSAAVVPEASPTVTDPPTVSTQEFAPTAASTEPIRFSVAATGDFLIHGPVYARALRNGGGSTYNFRPMFRYIRSYIRRADLAICHFETPMAPGAPAGYPVFNTPKKLAKDARAIGWDMCDTASNHTVDKGQRGVNSTLKAIRSAGIVSHGSARKSSRYDIPMVEVQGVKVALLSYTESTNGIPLPHSWSVNLLDTTRIKSDAARAKAAGAKVVIVNMHAGTEYQHAPSARQRQVARILTASPDIDAIIGQHVHVVQPIKWKHGKPIVYGEGNLISNQTGACCPAASMDGILAQLYFVVDGDDVSVERVKYVPVTVRRPDYAVIPIGKGLRKGLMNSSTLRASYGRTVSVIGKTARVRPQPANAG